MFHYRRTKCSLYVYDVRVSDRSFTSSAAHMTFCNIHIIALILLILNITTCEEARICILREMESLLQTKE